MGTRGKWGTGSGPSVPRAPCHTCQPELLRPELRFPGGETGRLGREKDPAQGRRTGVDAAAGLLSRLTRTHCGWKRGGLLQAHDACMTELLPNISSGAAKARASGQLTSQACRSLGTSAPGEGPFFLLPPWPPTHGTSPLWTHPPALSLAAGASPALSAQSSALNLKK